MKRTIFWLIVIVLIPLWLPLTVVVTAWHIANGVVHPVMDFLFDEE